MAFHIGRRRINSNINQVNEGLIFLRMPLFFFVTGFFLQNSLRKSWKEFLRTKINRLLYLFIIWSSISYVLLTFIPKSFNDSALEFSNPLNIFLFPPATLWFIYALAIGMVVMKLIRKFSILINLPILLLIYWLAAQDGNWRHVEFHLKLGRLIPFMYLGFITFEHINRKLKTYHLYFIPLLFILPYVYPILMDSIFVGNPVATIFASFLGIITLLSFSYSIANTTIGKKVYLLGKSSLFIYVMHKIVIAYSKPFFGTLPQIDPLWIFMFSIIVGITVPILVKKYMIKGPLIFLFEIPKVKTFKIKSAQN